MIPLDYIHIDSDISGSYMIVTELWLDYYRINLNTGHLQPILLTWFNFNPSMDK